MKKTAIYAMLCVLLLAGTSRAEMNLYWTITPNAAVAYDGTPLDMVIGTLDAGPGEKVVVIDFGPGLSGTFYQDWMFNGAYPSVYTDAFGAPTPAVDTHLLFASENEVIYAVPVTEDNDKSMSVSAGWGTNFGGAIGILSNTQAQTTDFIQMYIASGTYVDYVIIAASLSDTYTFVSYPMEDDPVLSYSLTPDVAYARVDTPASITLSVENVGDLSSRLYGAFPPCDGEFRPGSTSTFGPLGYLESDGRQYTYTPTDRGSDTQSITVMSNSIDGNVEVTLSGIGVGPVFDSSMAPGTTLDFDEVLPGAPESLYMDIGNITTDENGGDDALTDLTLLDVAIDGDDADLFEIVGFSADTLLSKGDVLCLELRYNGTGTPGMKSATLEVFTDEDAALGADGTSFSFDITANVVPEPSALVLLIVGVCCMAARRRQC